MAVSPVFATTHPSPVPETVVSMVEDFSKREFKLAETGSSLKKSYGFFATTDQIRIDQARLLRLAERYLVSFPERVPSEKEYGRIRERIFSHGAMIYVQADLHGDLASLLGLFEFWKQKRFMNAEYQLHPMFHLVFLGDYIDHGINDVEVLSLLLSLSLENPHGVSLLRGNHENIAPNPQYGPLRSDFFRMNYELLNRCFSAFQLAFLAASDEGHRTHHGNRQRQYVHMSHGLFSVGLNPAAYLEEDTVCIPVPIKIDISRDSPFGSPKAAEASAQLFEKFSSITPAVDPAAYLWSEIAEQSGPSSRRRGYSIGCEDIVRYRRASARPTSKVCAFVRGHAHAFFEHMGAPNKVIATTLPVANATGIFDLGTSSSCGLQGILYQVNPRVRDWKKNPVVVRINPETHLPTFDLVQTMTGMYERVSEPLASVIFPPLLSAASPSPSSCSASVVSLVQEFSQREFQVLFGSVHGFYASSEQKEVDQGRLLQIMREYKSIFECTLTPFKEYPGCFGTLDERLLSKDTLMYVQADLHGDLATLMGLLETWQQLGHLDAEYHTRPGFHLVFLGDYIDRGGNDVEVLSLLLALALENPMTVHLVRGNHEDVYARPQDYSAPDFIHQYAEELSACFNTFPLALLVASEEGHVKRQGNCQHQYVHMSHGLFPIGQNPAFALQGKDNLCVVLERTPPDIDPLLLEKSERARRLLFEKFQNVPKALHSNGYLWSDIEERSGPSSRGDIGYTFSPEDVFLYRQISSNPKNKVCAFVRGHQHLFKEHVVSRKVIATTLPVARATGVYGEAFHMNPLQGILYRIAKRVKDWKKRALFVELDPSSVRPLFHISSREVGMYEPCLG